MTTGISERSHPVCPRPIILIALSWGLGGLLGVTCPVLAETRGEIRLSGVVPPRVILTPTLTPEAEQLDLSRALTLVQIAHLEVETNTSAGYSLTATPGSLSNATGQSLDYQVSLTPEPSAAVDPELDSYGQQTLYLQYEPTGQPEPDTYLGAITLTLSDHE